MPLIPAHREGCVGCVFRIGPKIGLSRIVYHIALVFCNMGFRSKSQSGEGIEALAGTNVAQTWHKPAEGVGTPTYPTPGVGVAQIASASNTQHVRVWEF